MIDKNKILEAWIMSEHLSEGNFNEKDTAIRTLETPIDLDFYSMFKRQIFKSKIGKYKTGGVVLYFDIFDFMEVVSILREQYKLKPAEEEITSGKKFGFALYFDKDLNYMPDMMFFTESAYIRYYKKVPHESEFRAFENDLKNEFSKEFSETANGSEKFNEAFVRLLEKFNMSTDNCRIQFLKNVETGAVNLHSFFINDLEKAKNISTQNLEKYLYGNTKNRVDLDSKKDSAKFAPSVFEDILQPKNYPLGRFPGSTKYALSLMQQAAVNLSIGYDTETIRSVNGPPGTGKTTLLKDIFAELIVKQARDIAALKKHTIEGTEKTVYYNNASIGVIPENIAENGVVVASSNNGAVQNIVNELPLIEGQIDEKFADELKNADYFSKLANSKVTTKWEKDENGKKYLQYNIEHNEGEDKFWGLFSLEGGKSANMASILANINCVLKYLNEEYEPDSDVYTEFLEQYDEVKGIRDKMQKLSKTIASYRENCAKLDELKREFDAELKNRNILLNGKIFEIENALKANAEELAQSERLIEEIAVQQRKNQADMESAYQYSNMLLKQKPGFFAPKSRKLEHEQLTAEASAQLKALREKELLRSQKENDLRGRIKKLANTGAQYSKQTEALRQDLASWKTSAEEKIAELEEKVRKLSRGFDIDKVSPLNMTQDYDKLHLSNPWFGEEYRVAQSRLFIKALMVRKQFLYDNRKNVRAAALIWSMQGNYLEKKHIIAAAWSWINMTIPVISSTFASFSRMCKNLEPNTLGHLFIDEAGQAVPQAGVGAIFRSRHVMAVGDPSQIKPVLTLDPGVLSMLNGHFGVTEKYLSASASVQTLTDAASRFGFYREQDRSEDSWIGIPLWVHRRCLYPMFTISNKISYNGFMVQGKEGYGKTGWFNVKGKAADKYVEAQGEFLLQKIKKMMEADPAIGDKSAKDVIYVISPFANVAYQLAQKLKEIGFTRFDNSGKPTNVGTIHTFQGKEAPIVFMVLGADKQSAGAARWAVSEPNMMNVAATRAKEEFYLIGDKQLYLENGGEVVSKTYEVITKYGRQHPELSDNAVKTVVTVKAPADDSDKRIRGKIDRVGQGKTSKYAYIIGDDNKRYTINENIYLNTAEADEIIKRGNYVSFIPEKRTEKTTLATQIKQA